MTDRALTAASPQTPDVAPSATATLAAVGASDATAATVVAVRAWVDARRTRRDDGVPIVDRRRPVRARAPAPGARRS